MTYLQDMLDSVSLKALHSSFLLSKFDGSVVKITADAVTELTEDGRCCSEDDS